MLQNYIIFKMKQQVLQTFLHNIDLYDLNESDSQVFKIIFRDSSFLPVEDALINVYRKYVDKKFCIEIVEIPMTDKKRRNYCSFSFK